MRVTIFSAAHYSTVPDGDPTERLSQPQPFDPHNAGTLNKSAQRPVSISLGSARLDRYNLRLFQSGDSAT